MSPLWEVSNPKTGFAVLHSTGLKEDLGMSFLLSPDCLHFFRILTCFYKIRKILSLRFAVGLNSAHSTRSPSLRSHWLLELQICCTEPEPIYLQNANLILSAYLKQCVLNKPVHFRYGNYFQNTQKFITIFQLQCCKTFIWYVALYEDMAFICDLIVYLEALNNWWKLMIRNHLLILLSSWSNSINVPDKLCCREIMYFRFVSCITDSLSLQKSQLLCWICGLLLLKMFASFHVPYMLDKAKGRTGFDLSFSHNDGV